LDQLFAPWRMAYIDGADKQEGCIFCDFPKANEDRKRLILARGELVFVILNAFPYNPGHLMVAPFRHEGDYENLKDEECLEMHRFGQRCVAVLKEAMNPQGFNIGMNLGKAAGAGIAEHIHVHVIPRWEGDTNFMSVVGNVRVIPQDLAATAAALIPLFEKYCREV